MKIYIYGLSTTRVNLLPAKLSHITFYPIVVVSRYRDPQLKVSENYSYSFNLSPKHLQILMFEH